jgi:outer membrane protein assembly factor BamB
MIRIALVFAAISMLAVTQPVAASELMSPEVARQLGFTEAWRRPINAPFGAQSIADQQLFVHQTDPLEYIEIVSAESATPAPNESQPAPDSESESESAVASNSETNIPAPQVFGRIEVGRMGKETVEANRTEAMRQANNEIRRLKRRGIAAVTQTRKVPRVNLYSLATNGALESRNAETGELNWTVMVGDSRLPFFAIGVDDEYLSIVNGSNIIQVDVTNGEVLHERRTRGTPLYGAVNAGDFVMIPMVSGNVEGYPLFDLTRDPFLRSVLGSSLAMPTKAEDSSLFAWGTDQGYVFVAESSGKPHLLFRLKTDGNVHGRIASAPGNRFFFGSESGQVYGLRATRTGEVMWSQPFAEPFYNEPAVVGDQVLLSSVYGTLVSFDAETGFPTWEQPVSNVATLFGAFDGRLYVTTMSDALAVIDLETGKQIGVYPELRPEHPIINKQTDRIYLVSTAGEVQCLRPEGADLPTFITAPDIQTSTETADKPSDKPSGKSPFDAGDEPPAMEIPEDPFGAGGGDDPFGAPGDAFGGDDPFAQP